MKDIKFRFWSGREMYYMDSKENIEWVLECMKQKLLFDSGLHAGLAYDHIGTDIMQYTGLMDKNGREIFEGDLVSVTDGCFRDGKLIGEVRQNEYGTWLVRGNGVFKLYDLLSETTIIGNIYETAEKEQG